MNRKVDEIINKLEKDLKSFLKYINIGKENNSICNIYIDIRNFPYIYYKVQGDISKQCLSHLLEDIGSLFKCINNTITQNNQDSDQINFNSKVIECVGKSYEILSTYNENFSLQFIMHDTEECRWIPINIHLYMKKI